MTFYILFFIHVGSRKVYFGGITASPCEGWTTQAARNLTMTGCPILDRCRHMIRGRDTKFTTGFEMIFRHAGIRALKLPPRGPNLNAFSERFVRLIKDECLNRMIFFGKASLHREVTHYIEHYHAEQPHQGIGNVIPFLPDLLETSRGAPIACDERLGGLLRSYRRKAAA